MMHLFLRKALGVVTVLSMFFAFIPTTAHASWLAAPTNLALSGGLYTNDTTPTATWTRPSDATWYQVLLDDGTWIDLGNVSSYTLWTLPSGWHTFYVRAQNNSGDVSVSAGVTFEIDTAGPTVPAVAPSSATEDRSTTFSVTPSGEATTSSCDLYVSGSNTGAMSKNGSTFSKNYTFTNSGSYTVYARCTDGDGNTTTGTSRTVSVSEVDEEPVTNETFWVNGVTPTSATEDQSTTMKVTTSGTLDANTCTLYINGSSVGSMSETSSSHFSKSYTFTNNGTYTAYAYCEDQTGSWERGASINVSVSNAVDTETFTVPTVSPSTATEDESTTFTVYPYGTLDAETCKLYVSGSSAGTMDEVSTNHFELDYTFTNDGSYSVYAYCQDENGNWEYGSSRTISVSNDDDDNDTLNVPTVTPSTATEDEQTTFTVRPSSNYNVTDCWLYIDGSRVESMDEESTNRFTADYTFKNDGSYSVYAYCKDSHGNAVTGDKRTVRVSNATSSTTSSATRGSLIKIACSGSVKTNDTCKAVYYYGNDGKRHVFPNESVFFTWYNDFDDVVEVSSSFMSSLTIGKNVTYRPGSVVLKFDSSSKVYAIETDHTLHHYTSISLLKSDYGSDWTNAFVRVPDYLYGNYTVGSDIDSTRDYDRDDAYYSVSTINDVL